MKKILNKLFLGTSAILFLNAPVLSSCSKCKHILTDELLSLYPNSVTPGALWKCSRCGKGAVGPNPTAEKIQTPIVKLDGDFSQLVKFGPRVKLSFTYTNPITNETIEADSLVKMKGSLSQLWPKNSLNIHLYKKNTDYQEKLKVQFDSSWIKSNKLAINCNYFDRSNIRALVVADILSNAYKQENIQDEYSQIYNCGINTGFPIVFYRNETFWGTYNLMRVKNEDLFSSPDKTLVPMGVFAAEDYTASTYLKEHIADDLSNGWSVEYNSQDDNQWMIDSFNNFIDFINNNEGEAFKSGISNYTSVERIQDYVLLAFAFFLLDNRSKNMIWVTYDGTKWLPFFYDLDLTVGLCSDQSVINPKSSFPTLLYNKLFSRFWDLYLDEMKTKYDNFRQSALSPEQIDKSIQKFSVLNSTLCFDSNGQRWPDAPYKNISSTEYISNWLKTRFEYLDNHDWK